MLPTDAVQPLTLKAKLFRGFADPSRLSIIEALREGARSVSELVERTGLTQSNASNHLACLLDCGLVVREPRGRYAFYRLADERVASLLGLSDAILLEVACGVPGCVRYDAAAEGAP